MAAPFSIRNFVKKQMMKTNDEGIMVMPSDMKLDFGEAVLTKQLMDAGISPGMIKNEKQLISLLDSIDKMMQKAAAPIDKGIASSKSAKIFNLQGEKLDPDKPIIGGTQQGKKINREFFERDASVADVENRIKNITKANAELKMLLDQADPKFIDNIIKNVKSMDPIEAMKEANKVIKREGPYKNLSGAEAKKILKDTEDHIFERDIKPKETDMDFDDNDFADGGRIGFKKGMTRRKFLEIMGGVGAAGAAAKTGLLKLMGKEKTAPVVEKAAEVLGGGTPPPYFTNLVEKIRALGTLVDDVTLKERSQRYKYKDFEMDIDNDTGQIEITKKTMGYNDNIGEGVVSEEYMGFKPGQADETTGGKKVVDEYEENTAFTDKDGKMKDVEPGVSEETILEGSTSKEQLEQEIVDQISNETTKIKKAEGGRIPFVFGGGVMKVILQNLAKEKGISASEYLRITNYKSLPDAAKRIMSQSEFLKLKQEMTGKRVEMVENIRDMIESRQAFDKSKDDLRKSMNMASEGYGDEAVKMMFPEGSFKSPVPAGAGEKDLMMMEQLIKNLKTKDREVNASGGLAGMLGE
jgi:hypothetical protein